jgi:peptidoglycan/LPS O-acetylase OafA/YrhL
VSVEEQLYILLPLVIFFKGKSGLKFFSLFALIAAYITIVYYAHIPTKDFSGQWTNSFVHFQFFAAGILLSVFLNDWQPKWNFVIRIILFLSGYVCWLLASIVCEVKADTPHFAAIVLSISSWFLILSGVICFFLSFYGAPARYMPKTLVYLGRISYGMYVSHITMYWIIFRIFKNKLALFCEMIGLNEWKNEVGIVLVFIATVTFAILSYHFFEKPFLRLKERFTLIPSRDLIKASAI